MGTSVAILFNFRCTKPDPYGLTHSYLTWQYYMVRLRGEQRSSRVQCVFAHPLGTAERHYLDHAPYPSQPLKFNTLWHRRVPNISRRDCASPMTRKAYP